MSETERFWAKVNKTDTCWIWTGCTTFGYGKFSSKIGHRIKHFRAHRWAYEHLIGPIPDGLTIDHLCRNTACVNPAHLEAIPNKENILRGIGPSAVNKKKTHCPKGHAYSETAMIRPSGARRCRVCDRIISRDYQRRKRAGLLWRGDEIKLLVLELEDIFRVLANYGCALNSWLSLCFMEFERSSDEAIQYGLA